MTEEKKKEFIRNYLCYKTGVRYTILSIDVVNIGYGVSITHPSYNSLTIDYVYVTESQLRDYKIKTILDNV